MSTENKMLTINKLFLEFLLDIILCQYPDDLITVHMLQHSRFQILR